MRLKIYLAVTALCLVLFLALFNTRSAESQEEPAATNIMFMPIISGATINSADASLSRNGHDGNTYKYTLKWTKENAPEGITYTIKESRNPNMDPVTKTYSSDINALKLALPASTNNVYYYTVQADSVNASVSEPFKVVGAYRDDFDANTGWDIRRQDFDDTENVMSYQDGHLKMHVRGRWDYFITSPLAEAPEPPYRISTSVKFDGPGNLNTYGLIFGADHNGKTCPSIFPPAGRAANVGGSAEYDILPTTVRAPQAASNVEDNCLNHYYRMMFLWKDGFDQMHGQFKQINYHDDNNSGRGDALSGTLELKVSSGSANEWNDWSIEVYPDGQIFVYGGADRVWSVNSGGAYINEPYFGFWASTDEYPGSDPLWDYLLIEPLDN